MYDGNVWVNTPKRQREAFFHTRNDTNDAALVVGIVRDDEYHLGKFPDLEGVAVDVGAHIGAVTVALALDHPGLRVIAIEAVPENVEVLRANVKANKLEDRVVILHAAAAEPGRKRVSLLWGYRSAGAEPAAYVADSRYIANIYDAKDSDADRHTVPAVDLDTVMDGLDSLAALKVDCEGCEWQFLQSPRTRDVAFIFGEFHNGDRLAGLRALLAEHDVTQLAGPDDVGLFEAVRR